jgi:hypothetical protein
VKPKEAKTSGYRVKRVKQHRQELNLTNRASSTNLTESSSGTIMLRIIAPQLWR